MMDFLPVTFLRPAISHSLIAGRITLCPALLLLRLCVILRVFSLIVPYHVNFFFISSFCQSNSSQSLSNLCGVHNANLK